MSSLPSIPNLFNAWCRHQGDPMAVAAALTITPAELLRLIANPKFIEMKLAWQAVQLEHLESLARSFRAIAASKMREVLQTSTDPVEHRKGVTTLARLANTLIHGPRARATDRPTPVPENPACQGRSVSSVPSDPAAQPTPNPTPARATDRPTPVPEYPTCQGRSVSSVPIDPAAQPTPSPTPTPTPPRPLTRADLLRRMVAAATLPTEISPIVSLPPHRPNAHATLPARLIKSAGARPTSAQARNAPQWQPPSALQRLLTNVQEWPQPTSGP